MRQLPPRQILWHWLGWLRLVLAWTLQQPVGEGQLLPILSFWEALPLGMGPLQPQLLPLLAWNQGHRHFLPMALGLEMCLLLDTLGLRALWHTLHRQPHATAASSCNLRIPRTLPPLVAQEVLCRRVAPHAL